MMRYFMIGLLQFKSASNSDLFLANSFVSLVRATRSECMILYFEI